jgi:hypothetical protein
MYETMVKSIMLYGEIWRITERNKREATEMHTIWPSMRISWRKKVKNKKEWTKTPKLFLPKQIMK